MRILQTVVVYGIASGHCGPQARCRIRRSAHQRFHLFLSVRISAFASIAGSSEYRSGQMNHSKNMKTCEDMRSAAPFRAKALAPGGRLLLVANLANVDGRELTAKVREVPQNPQSELVSLHL